MLSLLPRAAGNGNRRAAGAVVQGAQGSVNPTGTNPLPAPDDSVGGVNDSFTTRVNLRFTEKFHAM
jgi:hypothetical protein